MSTRGTALKRLVCAIVLVVAIPTAVVTCQGRTFPDGDESAGGNDSNILLPGTGGRTVTSTANQGGTDSGTLPMTGPLGGSVAPTSTPTSSPTSGRVFLGKYLEPPVAEGSYYLPAPPATATVGRPCEERQDVCGGVQDRQSWANSVVAQCAAETVSLGCIDFIFAGGANCAGHLVYWNGATLDLGRCVATVNHYESCSRPTESPTLSVIHSGTACP